MSKADFLKRLEDVKGDKVFVGQHFPGNWQSATNSYAALIKPLPEVPAALGITVLVGDTDSQRDAYNLNAAAVAQTHLIAGGIVVVDVHMPSPWSNDQSITSAWVKTATSAKPPLTALTSLSSGSFGGVTNSLAYSRFRTYLSRLQQFLHNLDVSTGRVIVRPLHEANGAWFWWGADVSNSVGNELAISALFSFIANAVRAVSSEIVIAWSAGISVFKPMTYGYPGSGVIDMVGCSIYSDTFTTLNKFGNDWAALIAMNKPLAIFEMGDATTTRKVDTEEYIAVPIEDSNNTVVLVMAWQDSFAWVNNLNYSSTLGDINTGMLSDVPAPVKVYDGFVDTMTGTAYHTLGEVPAPLLTSVVAFTWKA